MNTRLLATLFTAAIIFASANDLFARSTSAPSSASSVAIIWVVVLGVFLFIAGLVVLFLYLDKKRSEKIQAAATRLGFTFRRKPTDADKALIAGCHIANSGHSHVTANVIEAGHSDELRMTLFDHNYTIGYGKSSQQYNQTITKMQAPLLNLPVFVLFPETFFSKIGKLFGGTDINFPEAPEFSKKYILRGPDEGAIRALFTPALIQFLERQQKALSIDAAGDTLFVHRTNRRAKPEELEGFVTEGKQILAKFFEAQNAQPPATPPPLPPPLPV